MRKRLNLFKLKNWTVLLMSLLLLSACQEQSEVSLTTEQTSHQIKSPTTTKKEAGLVILALGDSLTEGFGVKETGAYPAILQAHLKQNGFEQVKVINSGFSGETSSGLKNRLDWVLQLQPDVTILNIGANDAMRGLPLELTQENINDIIMRLKKAGSQVVLAGMQIYDNLGQEYVSGFKNMYPQLAKQHDIPLIPFFLEHVAGDSDLNISDMIHPNTAGYEIIVTHNILPILLPELTQYNQANNN